MNFNADDKQANRDFSTFSFENKIDVRLFLIFSASLANFVRSSLWRI